MTVVYLHLHCFRHVKNLTRGGEGKLPADALNIILGNVDRSHVNRPRREFTVS